MLAAIASTKPKASGPDGLSVLLLRACRAELAEPLARLFTLALRTELPPLFKQGKTILLPKSKGQAMSADPSDYRPITLLPALTRLLHKVVDTRLRAWLAENGGLSPVQTGFWPGHSTLEQVAVLSTLASLQQRARRELYMAFLDIAKAFDSFSHAHLLSILRRVIGLPLEWVEVIRRLLVGLSTTIFDEVIGVTRGTPQGSPLSPSLPLLHGRFGPLPRGAWSPP